MEKFHALFVIIPALLAGGALARADSLSVQLVGLSQNDGSYYVLPYELSVDGGLAVGAICYDFMDEVTLNEVWQASDDTLAQAGATGEFGGQPDSTVKYEEVAWLASQWFTGQVTTPQEQIELQYMIWDVFDPTAEYLSPNDPYIAYLENGEANGVANLNASDFTFLEAVPGTGSNGSTAQSFVIYTPGSNQHEGTVPEPGSLMLIAVGAILIGASRLRRAGTGSAAAW